VGATEQEGRIGNDAPFAGFVSDEDRGGRYAASIIIITTTQSGRGVSRLTER